MENKEYMIFMPFITVDGERVRANIKGEDLLKIDDIGKTHEDMAVSIIDEKLNKGISTTIDIGYLVTPDSLQKENELDINRDYACMTIREQGQFCGSLLVNIQEFLTKLRELGIELFYKDRIVYGHGLTILVEDGGFDATPEIRASRTYNMGSNEQKKHI